MQEEPWEVVTNGKHTYVANIKYDRPVQEVLKLARSQIGSWKYSLIDNNCEHFAKWATGLDVSSTQVIAGASGALAGVAIIGTFSENPKFAKFLGGIVLIGGLAILATKAVEKK
ncbi:H-REV 107-related protein [Vibrio ishigakensis]|uniref:H-REV 107-related protein n=1 Tax=Vibrio ishigakensis TaxID=1481914 RepID=A0A0B8PGM1_9VIBR|nr:H-REV 107-related protein [Vibrio ishigakensis]